jgi:transcriptional regulator with XRE-family HTH domain
MQRNRKLDLLLELCALGQNELADLCGMDKAAMSRIINGKQPPSPRHKAAITRVLEERLRGIRIDSSMVFGT